MWQWLKTSLSRSFVPTTTVFMLTCQRLKQTRDKCLLKLFQRCKKSESKKKSYVYLTTLYCFHYLWGVKFSDRWTSLTEMNCSHLTTTSTVYRLAFTFHFWHSCPQTSDDVLYVDSFFSHGFCAMTRSGSTPSVSFIYYQLSPEFLRETFLIWEDDSVISRSQANLLEIQLMSILSPESGLDRSR